MEKKKVKPSIVRSFRLIDFQVYDHSEDQESSDSGSDEGFKKVVEKSFMIQMFGINEKGETACLYVNDYKPFFYAKVGDNWTQYNANKLKKHLTDSVPFYVKNSLISCKIVDHYKLYGFSGGNKSKFVMLTFENVMAMNKYKNLWHSYENDMRVRHNIVFEKQELELYESNIPPLLRYFHIYNVSPSGWISINTSKVSKVITKTTTCKYEYICSLKYITSQIEKETSVPYKICSFDIEASSSHGDFPLPIKTYKRLATNMIDTFLKMKEQLNEDKTKLLIKKMILAGFGYGKFEDIDLVYPQYKITKERVEKLTNNLLEKSLNDFIKEGEEDNSYLLQIDTMFEEIKEAQNAYGENEENEEDICEEKEIVVKKTAKKTKFNKKTKLVDVLFNEKFSRDELIKMLDELLTKPYPKLKGDEVTFIGSTFMNYGKKEPYLNHCLVVGTCDDVDGAEIETVSTEKDILVKWTELIQRENPDIIIGYNIFGFDYEFMFRRALENNCADKFLMLSRNKKEKCYNETINENGKKEINIEQSSIILASGQHDLRFIKMNGRLQVDLYNYFRRDYNLTSYKLDYVAGYFIGDNVKKIEHQDNISIIYSKNLKGLEVGSYINFEETSHSTDYYKEGQKFKVIEINHENSSFIINSIENPDMTKNVKWGLAKDDVTPQDIFRMTNEGPNERAVIAKYCIQDCNLVHHLMNKIDVMTGYVEMAKICSVPINFLVMRGQGIKLTSYIAKKCREKNTLMPVVEKPEYVEPTEGDDWNGYDGAIVLDPKCSLYLDNPVACVDYSSLYPSSMISENLSHDSKVWTKEYDLEGNIVRDKYGREKITGTRDVSGNFIYDNLPEYTYVDVEYDTYKWTKNERGKTEKVVSGKKVCRFAQFKQGKAIMPSILEELLASRKATRKLIPQQTDEFMKNILDKRQLSYKLTANSLYGQCGAKTSTFYEKDVAAATTSTGRKLLTYAKRVIEEAYGDLVVETKYGKMKSNAEYIYGDTDSVFFTFNFTTLDGEKVRGKKALEMTIDLAQEAGELASKFLKGPHDLEYEKTFMPFCLLSKKRYVGMLYELDPEKCSRKSMGIVLKRRDNAPIVKDVYGGIIDILMKDQDIEKAIEFLKSSLQNIVDEKYPLEKLIITKSLRSNYKNPQQIAHKVLADRMGKRDPGNKPGPGDRIPFVYIQTKNKNCLQGEKIEHPQYLIDNKLKPNYSFYITNQIMKPVQQVFALVLEDMKLFKRKKKNFEMKVETLKDSTHDEIKLQNKIIELRNKEVKSLLFDKYLIETNNLSNGNQNIKNFFK
jgi:DNA polymerase elongation subunit (family B)